MLGVSAPPLRILVADDEPLIADRLAGLLKRSGARVHVVYSGHAALAAVRAVSFDAVVLDWKMPGSSGEQVASMIRARRPGVKIVAISGAAPEDFRAIFSAGLIDAFLQKPVKADALVRVVEKVATPADTGRGHAFVSAV